jgi:putative Mn2+ efflux pump MntP
MGLATTFLIAVALAADAFAVAVSSGIVLARVSLRQTFRLSWHFGLFQGGMVVLGWLGGSTVHRWIEAFDHWVAFALLALVGGRMIREALGKQDEEVTRIDPTKGRLLVALSVATSIDAFSVGLSFSMLGITPWWPALIIGVIALSLTGAGLHLGRLLGATTRIGRGAGVFGGLVLIFIAVRILHDHNVF